MWLSIWGIEQYTGITYYDLKEVCVSTLLQRHGVGKNLMGKLEDVLRENGVSKIHLITQRDGIPSSFYASLGFSENENMIIMGKSVKKDRLRLIAVAIHR